MHTISKKDLCKALLASHHGVSNWLAGTEGAYDGKRHLFSLTDVIAAVRAKRKRGLGPVEARALIEIDRVRREGDALYVGDSARQRAIELTAVLTPAEAARLKQAKGLFTGALVEAFFDRSLFRHLEELRDILILCPDVLYFVLTGDAAMQPAWHHFAPAFAAVNAPETTTKEAA